ncbi:adenylate/guanylate cyclase with integral membrane sensor [[Leptolyngbya] sp. PCC 7376]|uniref:adenylate/guanylate cyclase domain-containing protein n=1 Tax=[Leptolyngbya] sp. PCC 7376 TaxID=111781 RepID=UPI00029F4546|nr:adenylate/guanylate cyclase domain-containing protein [[Leptolyngbya] sp. PCC 7376]AFY39844.1 adenylate/guanylate cyclase with integral membrane sensor [[Leptolyngbya] sp. PCC 7376]
MVWTDQLKWFTRKSQQLPLRLVLVVPFLLQIFGVVGLVGYWSLRNGQKSVDTLVQQLQTEIGREIDLHLRSYLREPDFANRATIAAVELGLVDPTDQNALTTYFRRLIKDNPQINTIQYGSLEGDYIGIGRWKKGEPVLKIATREMDGKFQTLRLNSEGKTTYIYNTRENYVLQDRDWFKNPVGAQATRWSPVYVMFSNRMLGLTLAEPVENASGEMIGVIGTDVLLAELNIFLKSLEVGKTGQAFILERNGALIGSSTLRSSLNFQNDQERPERLLAEVSEDDLIESTTRYLRQEFGSLENIDQQEKGRINLDGKTHFLQVSPYQDEFGLDWLVIQTIPESDFMAQIHVNTRNTILMMFVGLCIASWVGLMTSRWIASPILQLSQAAIALAEGEWNVFIPNYQTARVGMMRETTKLALAFNRMRSELQKSFDDLAKAKSGLEVKVQERTRELRASEIKYRGIYDNSQVGIFRTRVDNGLVIDANARCVEMMGYDSGDEVIGRLTAADFYADLKDRTKMLQQVVDYELHNFETRFRRKDGSILHVLISGRYNQEDRCLEGVINDISEQKKADEALKQEQAKAEALLLNILPEAIATQLKEKPGTIAEQYDQATILFADIVDFTPLASRLSAQALLDILNQVFSQFDELADQYGLEKIKTIGDAYMVAGGLPIPDPNHVAAIADMALAMIDIAQNMSPLQVQLDENTQLNHLLRIRIGINTGEVIAGVIGTKKFIYDLWGDSVNVASRMESSGEPNLIQVTESTYELLKDDYIFEQRGMISVKGKGAMTTYWLLGKAENPGA